MSFRDLAFKMLDDFKFAIQQQRAAFQPRQNRVIQYRNPMNSQEKKAIPTFGVEAGAFGLDWAADAPVRYRGGSVPRPILHNVDGHVPEDAKPLLEPVEAYVDPNISPRGSRTSESTDQKPIRRFTGEVIGDKWDGIVRNKPKHDFQGVRGQSEPTLADLAEKDLKAYPYDFSV